jgi:phosphatidylglycerophosphatase A
LARAEPPPLARLGLAGLGAGWLRPGPGTWASLTVSLAVGASELAGGAGTWTAAAFLLLGSVITLRWSAGAVGPDGRHDPGWVVSDEWAGQGLACLIARPGADPLLAAATFALFRVFDIWKPGPIHRLQRWPGGVGVLLDDLAAGALAGLLAWGLREVT